MTKVPDDLHVLTGSYALDALDDLERKAFERHLQHCPTCDAEVRGLRETAARLARAPALRPPRGMEQRVLAAAYRTRQAPPLSAGRAGFKKHGRVHRRAWMPRLTAAVAVAGLAAAIGLGITQAATQHQLDRARVVSAAITRIIAAPDARVQTTRIGVGGTVTVVVSARQRAAVVTSTAMAALPSGRVYQLWVLDASGAHPAGLLSPAGLVLASGVLPGDRIGITVEPSGGTSRPTTTPVIILLPSA